MKVRPRHSSPPGLRRVVFWVAATVMLAAALFGLVWAFIVRDWTMPSIAALTVGVGALMVALAFGLLEFTSPTFHPESELFDWDDVDTLRALAREPALDPTVREYLRSLADRVAVVLPGREPQPPEERNPRSPAPRLLD